MQFIRYIYNLPAHASLMRNSMLGYKNSQYELAKFYLVEKKDYIEAYAWADVACCNNHGNALAIKQAAESNLEFDQIKPAWDKAREYKSLNH